VVSPVLSDLQPGAYLEGGGKIEAYKSLAEWVIFGANLTFIDRAYRTDRVSATGGKRRDVLWIPGASLLFPHVWSFQTDFRIDYRYISDQSNDSTKSFSDHVVTASLIYRFDPTQNFWSQLAAGRRR
jgi:hypothetical protein